MSRLELPQITANQKMPTLPNCGQVTIVGGAGAGKTRFMHKLIELNTDRAFCLSAVSAPYPERKESVRSGSIDTLFRRAVECSPYLKSEAVSELDKLCYLLVADEIEYLLNFKQQKHALQNSAKMQHTRLDSLKKVWEEIFPGNKIILEKGMLMFSTAAGQELIPASLLSQGEQSALYYCAAVLFAIPKGIIFIDAPSLFIHPSLLNKYWNIIEELRPDCTFVYDSVDVEFINSRTRNVCIWIKNYDAQNQTWDYEVMTDGDIKDEVFVDLYGTRRPVLFIEGDMRHSIDSRLYPLIFPDYTVKPLGSCNKVIETVRSFSEQKNMHHLESCGIVDRDRRTDKEVEYLKRKSIMVANVAEVENLFLIEGVIRTMAKKMQKDPDEVFTRISKSIRREFARRFDEQALQHVRYRVKREVECKVDARFTCITAMELHLNSLPGRLRPRQQYNELRRQFQSLLSRKDHAGILKVFNHKPMLAECGIAHILGYKNKDEYINGVIATLKAGGEFGDSLRTILRKSFSQ